MALPNMDPVVWVRNQLEEGEPDLLRAMVSAFAETSIGAEVADRVQRPLATSGPRGSPTLATTIASGREAQGRHDRCPHPKLRSGSYLPDRFIEPRRRARAGAVVADCYSPALSTSPLEWF